MKVLSQQAFQKARSFLLEQARPLERRLFELEFENGPVQAVVDELARYQNQDGGFGKALEPDFRLQTSSPMATSVAFQRIRQLALPADHPLVQGGIQYLIGIYHPAKDYWTAVPGEVNQVPHAPWWHYDEVTGKTAPETPANPTAEIVGYLQAYSQLVPSEFLNKTTEFSMHFLRSNADQLTMHDIFCYLRMSRELSETNRMEVFNRLKPVVEKIVARDPQSWAEYNPQPLMFVHSPGSPLASMLTDAIQANLDYRIETQDPDGTWAPNWSWGGNYPEAWEQARREWQGVLTLEALRSLKEFGRLGTGD